MSRLPKKPMRLETDVEVLWKRWLDARDAYIEYPTPNRLDARLEALKAFYLRFAGRKGLEATLADEQRFSEGSLVAAGVKSLGGSHGRR